MLDPYCGGTTCTRAAGSVLLRAKLTWGRESEFCVVRCGVVRCGVEDLLLGLFCCGGFTIVLFRFVYYCFYVSVIKVPAVGAVRMYEYR